MDIDRSGIGSASFLAPLHSESIIAPLVANLCPYSNPCPIVLAALRSLDNLATSTSLATGTSAANITTLADILFSKPYVISLSQILAQPISNTDTQSQTILAVSLISKLCREERHQHALSQYGVLEALATHLASIVVSEGCVVPGAEFLPTGASLRSGLQTPRLRNPSFAGIFEAITKIINNSKYRASQLLYSPAIMAVLPTVPITDIPMNRSTKAAWNAYKASGLAARQSQLNAMDTLLPCIPSLSLRNGSSQFSAFPPLGTSASRENLIHDLTSSPFIGRKPSNESNSNWPSFSNTISDDVQTFNDEADSPLIAWLIHLIRAKHGLERLMAASLLTVFHKCSLMQKSREAGIGLLVIPLLTQLLDEESGSDSCTAKDESQAATDMTIKWKVRELTPSIIAMLVMDSELLQKAAYDAKLLPILAKMIKIAYDPVPDASEARPWSPFAQGAVDKDAPVSSGSGLEQAGISPLLLHKLRVRESVLRAIAALGPHKDEYRKSFAELGVVPYIVESMRPRPSKPSPKAGDKPEGSGVAQGNTGYGVNPSAVLIAACGAVRALSRSTFLLRTTLIDDGVAMPLYNLLHHSDVEVQIAATAAVCNVVVEFSPMREVREICYGVIPSILTEK
jgi:hypothetical protein